MKKMNKTTKKKVLIGAIISGVAVTINALSVEFLGFGISVEMITDILTSIAG